MVFVRSCDSDSDVTQDLGVGLNWSREAIVKSEKSANVFFKASEKGV